MTQVFAFLVLQQLAQPQVEITVKDGIRTIVANGLPNHKTGQFPNRENPNSIREQRYRFQVPANPKENEQATPLGHQDFGIALNGVPFDPLTAEFWNNDPKWNYEAIIGGKGSLGIDQANAHVQPTGAYHYHGVPWPLVVDSTRMTLIGYAADGFPIYGPFGPTDPMDLKSPVKTLKGSYQLKKGTRSIGGTYDGRFTADWEYVRKSGDLDECNGRFGLTPEYPKGTYYYVVTEAYPYIPRMFKGNPDPSFRRMGPPPGGPGGRPGGPPPRPGGGEGQ
ncbi:MAG: YHYH protein [Armatimonadetes bacterium]|nr:YHYH protein [Armatimonadota bacterium]MBX3110112.1 YHYH protein [Fimbriimonadaceae bacterium]